MRGAFVALGGLLGENANKSLMSAAMASQQSGDKVSGELRQHSHNYMHDSESRRNAPRNSPLLGKQTTGSLTKGFEIIVTQNKHKKTAWLWNMTGMSQEVENVLKWKLKRIKLVSIQYRKSSDITISAVDRLTIVLLNVLDATLNMLSLQPLDVGKPHFWTTFTQYPQSSHMEI